MLVLSDSEVDTLREINKIVTVPALDKILAQKQFVINVKAQGSIHSRHSIHVDSPLVADALYAGFKQTSPTCHTNFTDMRIC